MLKNVSVMLTDKCNSRCSMCNIWNQPHDSALSADEFDVFFSAPEFTELEDISLTGGEPTLRPDLLQVADAIIKNKTKLKMLFLCTNGTNTERVRKFAEHFKGRVNDLFIAVSIEGRRETTRKIRGVDSYNHALEAIELCKGVSDEIHTIISATITPLNCDEENLGHIQDLASKTGSTYSFKPVIVNPTYYKNSSLGSKSGLDESQLGLLTRFIEKNCKQDPFMQIQLQYLSQGTIPLIGDKETGINCLAGDVFAFVRPQGEVFPCCYSSRKIGGVGNTSLLGKKVQNLGANEPCPCCNEMCVYPILNWASYSTK